MGNVDDFISKSKSMCCEVEDEFIRQKLESSSLQYLSKMKQSESQRKDEFEYLGKWQDLKKLTGEGCIFRRGNTDSPSLFYQGQITQGKANGKGQIILSKQGSFIYKYKGYFSENLAHTNNDQKGIYQTFHIKFEGKWENGQAKSGYLTIFDSEKQYQVKTMNFTDCKQGKVQIITKDFSYNGDIKKETNVFQIHGKGKITYFENGIETQTYHGTWKHNQIDEGTYKWKNGCSYKGKYSSSGERDGQGTYCFANGNTLIGSWKDGKKTGHFVLLDSQGKKLHEFFYEDDVSTIKISGINQ